MSKLNVVFGASGAPFGGDSPGDAGSVGRTPGRATPGRGAPYGADGGSSPRALNGSPAPRFDSPAATADPHSAEDAAGDNAFPALYNLKPGHQALHTTYPSRLRLGMSNLMQPLLESHLDHSSRRQRTVVNYAEIDPDFDEDEDVELQFTRLQDRFGARAGSAEPEPSESFLGHRPDAGRVGIQAAPRATPRPGIAPATETLVPIHISLDTERLRVRDTFVWNAADGASPEHFARIFCADTALAPAYAPLVARQISEQLAENAAIAGLTLAPDTRVHLDIDAMVGCLHVVDRVEWDVGQASVSSEARHAGAARADTAADVTPAATPATMADGTPATHFNGTTPALTRDGTPAQTLSSELPHTTASSEAAAVSEVFDDGSAAVTPELFARIFVRDTGLPLRAVPIIAYTVHDELLRLKRTCFEAGLAGDDPRAGPRALEGVWRDWNESAAFTPRFEMLTPEEAARWEAEHGPGTKRVKRDRAGGRRLPRR